MCHGRQLSLSLYLCTTLQSISFSFAMLKAWPCSRADLCSNLSRLANDILRAAAATTDALLTPSRRSLQQLPVAKQSNWRASQLPVLYDTARMLNVFSKLPDWHSVPRGTQQKYALIYRAECLCVNMFLCYQ